MPLNNNQRLRAFAMTAMVFTVLDLLWLGVVARGFYVVKLGPLLRVDTDWAAAAAFYLIYLCGIQYFVVWREAGSSWHRAAMSGALFGLVAYAACDITNLAMISGFPLQLVLVDLPWGIGLTAVASVAGHKALGLR